ncbi:hypothetical protein FOXG_14940 [Fusarium oxysporum f. sp. lycopersici 4287]|uniref:Uncharacterized protein n=1 Tax=Fusarium oxysporum f. sp. lycopersici (strain 4287 / CBS 123668 / FGSC 9935 / NRRL 34936) TaxID=426428 RepID=A0A0J9W212_FUSO4|nr:hypothetical protein FOXG_14940 [Fusarium oxysporum f. sp. lycopersici 4287]KNB16931.1 hypothetical protein FOXG_14940 [Fusarium oxysporum f. sp. lycopersici 4287]
MEQVRLKTAKGVSHVAPTAQGQVQAQVLVLVTTRALVATKARIITKVLAITKELVTTKVAPVALASLVQVQEKMEGDQRVS